MALKPREQLILWTKAGGCCSFPDCKKSLILDNSRQEPNVLLGDIAHIVAQREGGPRGNQSPPGGEIDSYENTILLCKEHHTIVDRQRQTYTIVKLSQFKKDHEEWVLTRLSKEQRYQKLSPPSVSVQEAFYSTALPLSQIPHYIFMAPCQYSEEEIRKQVLTPTDKTVMIPYIIRDGNLISFVDLRKTGDNPFCKAIDPYSAKAENAPGWWKQPDLHRWYMELLNRILNKLTGRKGLKLDKDHRRYYFEPDQIGVPKEIAYKSISGRQSTRNVAWNPRFNHNEQPKPYWEHLAVGLRFHLVDEQSWCLSIRPERRFTRDGYIPLEPKRTGKRSTRRKSYMYNLDVLTEVHFWRDFLSDGNPRIICKLGGQSLVIENNLLGGKITWPEIPGDVKPRMLAQYEDDLFTLAELNILSEFEDEVDIFEADEFDTDEGVLPAKNE